MVTRTSKATSFVKKKTTGLTATVRRAKDKPKRKVVRRVRRVRRVAKAVRPTGLRAVVTRARPRVTRPRRVTRPPRPISRPPPRRDDLSLIATPFVAPRPRARGLTVRPPPPSLITTVERAPIDRTFTPPPLVTEAVRPETRLPPRQVAGLLSGVSLAVAPFQRGEPVPPPRQLRTKAQAPSFFTSQPNIPIAKAMVGDFFQVSKTEEIIAIEDVQLSSTGKFPAGRVISREEAAAPRFREFQDSLSPLEAAFGSFTGGARQEFENIGAIAGFGTAREEVGSLAVDLPFEVAEKTFTVKRGKGEGFFGLGFDFQFDPEAGAAVSGRIQRRIGERFEEDPARALGSIATIGLFEAALFVGTGGAGTLAKRGLVGVGRKFAIPTKARKFVEKIIKEQPDAKKGRSYIIENKGDGIFGISLGQTEIKKRGVQILTPAKGVVTAIGRRGEEIVSKVPIFRTPVRFFKGRRKGKKIDPKRAKAAVVTEQADVPVIIIDTKTRLVRNPFTGIVEKRKPTSFLFNKNIPDRDKFLDAPSTLFISGVEQSQGVFAQRQIIATGLQAARGKAFGVTGRPTKKTIFDTAAAEEANIISSSARGIEVFTEDLAANPNLIGTFASTLKPIARGAREGVEDIFGLSPKLSAAEIKSGIEPSARNLLPFPPVELFSGKAIGGKGLSEFLSPKGLRAARLKAERKAKEVSKRIKSRRERAPKEAPSPEDIFKPTPAPARAGQPRPILKEARPTTAPRPTQVGEVLETFAPVARVKPVRVPLATRIGITSILPTQLAGVIQPVRDDFASFQGIALGEQIKIDTGQRLVTPQKQAQPQALDQIFQPFPTLRKPRKTARPIQEPSIAAGLRIGETPQFGLVTPTRLGVDVGVPFDTPLTTPLRTPLVTPFRAPRAGLPLFPFGERRRRRKGKKGRRSRLGRRLFDIADEPFGEVEVGLGFFIEQRTGRETIAEAIGIDEIETEPITAQERRARERLSKKGKKNNNQFDFLAGTNLGNLF